MITDGPKLLISKYNRVDIGSSRVDIGSTGLEAVASPEVAEAVT